MITWLPAARVCVRTAVAAAILFGGTNATATELDYRLSLGAGHSDNVNRVSTGKVDQDIATAGLRFSLAENTARLQTDVVGNLAYYEYFDDAYDSELSGNLDANAMFALVPDRFTWSLGDQFGQTLSEPFATDTPDNRENINYFSTGPDFMMALGSQMRLHLSGRYALADYEVSPLDSSSVGGQLALVRVLSARSTASLNASLQQVDYDDALNDDFDHSEVFLRYEGAGARTNLTVDIGYGQLDLDSADDTQGGMALRVDASRKISASSTLSFGAGHEFSNSAASFASGLGNSGMSAGTTPGRQTAEPFMHDHASLGWNYHRNLTGLGISASYSKNSYESSPGLDETLTTFFAQYSRDISPTTSLRFSATRTGVGYETSAPDYDELIAEALFSWRLSRLLTLEVKYDYSDRNGDNALTNYSENRFWLSLGFGRGEPRSTRVPPSFGVDAQSPAGN